MGGLVGGCGLVPLRMLGVDLVHVERFRVLFRHGLLVGGVGNALETHALNLLRGQYFLQVSEARGLGFKRAVNIPLLVLGSPEPRVIFREPNAIVFRTPSR